MKRFLAAACLVFVACTGGSNPEPSPQSLSGTELRLQVLDALDGKILFCGPPVESIGAPIVPMTEFRWIRAQRPVFLAILRHEGLQPGSLSSPEITRVVEVYKQTRAITLRHEAGGYSFEAYTPGGAFDHLVSGTVDASGDVTVGARTNGKQNCPICLAWGTRIATPNGPVLVTRIRVGMMVWSVDTSGHRIEATVLETRRRRAMGELLRIGLADGRTVLVSPAHPMAHGAAVALLAVGDRLSGSRIETISRVDYDGFTYDLLPSGPTGDYFADGILLGTTLRARSRFSS